MSVRRAPTRSVHCALKGSTNRSVRLWDGALLGVYAHQRVPATGFDCGRIIQASSQLSAWDAKFTVAKAKIADMRARAPILTRFHVFVSNPTWWCRDAVVRTVA
jgi:hypothetical protein